MSKRQQENYRTDDLTEAFLKEIVETLKKDDEKIDKSKVHRQAIAYFANYVLSQDQIQNIRTQVWFESFEKNKNF